MSEQEQTQVSANGRRTRQAKQNTSSTTLHRPTNKNKEGWSEYWNQVGQQWRREPEIDTKRQEYLGERRKITPNIEKGIYPFKDIEPKLSRADIEWLLATHENGQGPVLWYGGERQQNRMGLDLRGADLRGLNLRGLPLARTLGGLNSDTPEEMDKYCAAAIINLENADLRRAHLEDVWFYGANLKGAKLNHAYLEEAHLISANLVQANFYQARLQKTVLNDANLWNADISDAHLEEASLIEAHLEKACLVDSHLEGAYLAGAYLGGTDLGGVFFDRTTSVYQAKFNDEKYGSANFADIHWESINLALVDWSKVLIVGDEQEAIPRNYDNGRPKSIDSYIDGFQTAVRAYRQLSIVLRSQGLNEDASRFAFRSQLLQRKIFRLQKKYGQYTFSLLLDLLSGYGYKPWRSFMAYLVVIATFAIAYYILGRTVGPVLSPIGAFVFSMTSFHGRGFFPGGIKLDDPLTVLAALEAFVGLLIEVTFIATLTQRLFGK